MRRLFPLLTVLILGVAACSAPGAAPTTVPSVDDSTTSSDVTAGTEPRPDTTTSTIGSTGTTSGRPLAPDFTLELGEGGTYTLSEGSKPVYLVFWAEW